MCEECMNMPSSPVCSVRDGRTFPTRCHALMCQGYEASDLEDGACSERVSAFPSCKTKPIIQLYSS